MAKTKKKPKYKLTVTIDTEHFTSEGDDLVEVIMALKPNKVNFKTVFNLYTQGKSAETWLMVAKARQVLNNRMTAMVFARRLEMLLK